MEQHKQGLSSLNYEELKRERIGFKCEVRAIQTDLLPRFVADHTRRNGLNLQQAAIFTVCVKH